MGTGTYPINGMCPSLSGQSPAHQELRHHSIMYRNVILGNLAGVTCISLIFLSPSASCAAEHMPRLAAEAPGSDKQAQEHFQRISLNSFPGIFVAWEGGDRAGGDGLRSIGTALGGGAGRAALMRGSPCPPFYTRRDIVVFVLPPTCRAASQCLGQHPPRSVRL